METHRIVQTEEGYAWHISIEREIRKPGEAQRYPDKKVIKASLSGHEASYEHALISLNQARLELERLIREGVNGENE